MPDKKARRNGGKKIRPASLRRKSNGHHRKQSQVKPKQPQQNGSQVKEV